MAPIVEAFLDAETGSAVGAGPSGVLLPAGAIAAARTWELGRWNGPSGVSSRT